MRQLTGIFVLWGTLGPIACGGASQTDFSGPVGASGKSAGGSGGSVGKGGTTSTGGSTTTGGSMNAGGSGGSSAGTVGTTGGTDATGGSGMTTGGTDATGGSGMATGGTDATGGSNATGGTDATGGSGMTTGGTGGSDMTTGGSAGSGMQSGGTGGVAGSPSGGSGGMTVDCDALAMDYSTTLEQAEVCNPNSGKDQCTLMERTSLTCSGCSVNVNPDNQDAVAHLDELRQEVAGHCITPCPALACVVSGSSCVAASGSKTTGRCTNTLATTM